MLSTIRLLVIASLVSLTACSDMQDTLFDIGLKAERSMSSLNLKHIEVADHQWTYLDSQEGDTQASDKPVLLMLHGFAVDKDNWLRFARFFDDYRVIAPDLPGHGESSYNETFTYDFAQQAVWLTEFVDALKLKDVHIMGNSMGGGVALLYSHANADNVASITLIDAAGVYPPKASDLQKIIDAGGQNPLIVNSLEDFDRLREFAMAKQPFLPWPATNVLARRAQARNAINIKIFEDIHAVAEKAKHSDEHLKMLEEIKQPVLILWGEKDRALDVSSVAVFEHYLPDSRSFIFPDLGHAPMLEAPEDSAELVLEFVAAVEKQPKEKPAKEVKVAELNADIATAVVAVDATAEDKDAEADAAVETSTEAPAETSAEVLATQE